MGELQMSQLLGTWKRVAASAYASAHDESCRQPGCCFSSCALNLPAGGLSFEAPAEEHRANKSLDAIMTQMGMAEIIDAQEITPKSTNESALFLLMLPLLPVPTAMMELERTWQVEPGSAGLMFVGRGDTQNTTCMATWLEGCNSNTLVVVYDLDFIQPKHVENMHTYTYIDYMIVPCQSSRAVQEGAWPPRTCGSQIPFLEAGWKGRVTVSQRFQRSPPAAPCGSNFETSVSTEQPPSLESETLSPSVEYHWLPALPVAALACIAIFVLLCLCSLVMLAFHLYKRRAKSGTRAKPARAHITEMMKDETDSCEYFTEANMPHLMEIGRMEHWLIKNGSVDILQVHEGGAPTGRYVVEATMNGTTKVAVQKNPGSGLLNEFRILRHARHKNVVRLYGIMVASSTDIQLVLEWVSGSNLQDYVLQRRLTGSFDNDLRALATGPQLTGNSVLGDIDDPGSAVNEHRILADVARAMQYLHSLDPAVVHGDLTSMKILVEQIAHPPLSKVSDFRCGQLLKSSTPERTREEELKREVRAYGIVTLFIILGEPLEETGKGSPSAETIADGLQAAHALQDASFLGSLYLAISVAEDCLSTDMAQRPTFKDIFHCLCNSDGGNS